MHDRTERIGADLQEIVTGSMAATLEKLLAKGEET